MIGDDDGGADSRVSRFLDSLDSKSKRAEEILRGVSLGDRNPDSGVDDSVKSVPSDSGGRASRALDAIDKKSRILEDRIRSSSIWPNSAPKKSTKDRNEQSIVELCKKIFIGTWAWILSGLERIFSHMPYIIPATVIFQTAIWVGYLEQGTVSNNLISDYAESLGDAGRSIAILLSIFGIIGAYLLTMSLEIGGAEQVIPAQVIDLMIILMIISSLLYIMKKFQSLYYLALVFVGSVILRLIEAEKGFSISLLILCSVGLIGFYSSIALVIFSRRENGGSLREIIDTETEKIAGKILNEAEYSNPYSTEGWFEMTMDQAPVTKPNRPRRRSEYELYEWVLLLANLIMWPTVIVLSIILGSGDAIEGRSYSLEDNYLMLFGPLGLTLFFFVMLYRMDSNARDGSLYAAEKKSYLAEMEKYLEARSAYLELVRIQAENKKRELESGTSEE